MKSPRHGRSSWNAVHERPLKVAFRRAAGRPRGPRSWRNSSSAVRLELHPEARAELRSAALWYDERRPGLGDEFIAEVSAALDRIGDAPESYSAWPGTRAAAPLIRKITIQRFPYLIAFEKHERHLQLAAHDGAPAPVWSINSTT